MAEEADEIPNWQCNFVRDAPAEVRDGFDGMPDRVLFGENQALFRFLEPNYSGPLAGFWLSVDTYHYLRRLRECEDVRLPGWAVSGAALIRTDATMFCIATLLVKLYGFRGRAKVRDAAPTPLTRIWLPSLAPEQIHLRSYRL